MMKMIKMMIASLKKNILHLCIIAVHSEDIARPCNDNDLLQQAVPQSPLTLGNLTVCAVLRNSQPP